MKEILKPLAIANNNITQAANTRVDHVLLTLGNLYRIYNMGLIEPEIRVSVLSSLEKRWDAADQELFIVTLCLNPYIQHQAFKATLPRMELISMAERVFKRVFEVDMTGIEFMTAMMDYLDGKGSYSEENMQLAMWKGKFENEVS